MPSWAAPGPRTIHLMETLAGDTSVGHAWAYCSVLETLSGCGPAPRGQTLRAMALELERLANHSGDLGALARATWATCPRPPSTAGCAAIF